MKSFLRAAAATGVAAATLAAGLSIAPAAQADDLELGTPISFPSAWKAQDGYYAAREYPHSPEYVYRYADQASLPSDINNFIFIPAKGTDWGILVSTFDLHCAYRNVAASAPEMYYASWTREKCLEAAASSASSIYRWKLEGGIPVSDGWGISSKLQSNAFLRLTQDRNEWAQPAFLTATVREQNVEAGTAKLVDGVAPEGADSVEVSWKTADGATKSKNVTVKEDGTWSRDLDELALGKTTVHLEAFAGNESVAESDVEVDLAVSDLTANAAFSDDVDEVAHITGTATPNSSVVAFHGERQIQTTMADAEGKYSLAINPPNVGGPYDVRVEQRIRGQVANSAEVQLDYGTAVSITGPEDGATLDPGDDLVVRGNAQPGAKLKIYEQGKADAPPQGAHRRHQRHLPRRHRR